MKPAEELLDVLDLEKFVLEHGDSPKPRARAYIFAVNAEHFTTECECLPGREILRLAGKDPDDTKLFMVRRGSFDLIGPDEKVCFTAPGVERFTTLSKVKCDGGALRRAFRLLPTDEFFLDTKHFEWETVQEGGANWLLIRKYLVPLAFGNPPDLAVQIPPTYATTELDMAWFYPSLARPDGRAINGLSLQPFDGKQWQRWSRHRPPTNPWRPGIDDLRTHLAYVDTWLESEVA
jgi:E2/UBC family protein E/multiubiquitin